MQKNLKKTTSQAKTIKLDSLTHKSLRIYAVENDLTLGRAVRSLLDKVVKNNKVGIRQK
jgi:hypothetical protein